MTIQFLSKSCLTSLNTLFYFFVAEHDVICYAVYLWLVQVICSAMSPSNLLHAPNPYWGRRMKNKEGLVLCKHYRTIAETIVCYQCVFSHKSKTQHHRSCYEEKPLHPRQNQYTLSLLWWKMPDKSIESKDQTCIEHSIMIQVGTPHKHKMIKNMNWLFQLNLETDHSHVLT